MWRLPKKLQTDTLVVYKRYRFSRVRHETFKETERAKARRKERRFQPPEYEYTQMVLGDDWS